MCVFFLGGRGLVRYVKIPHFKVVGLVLTVVVLLTTFFITQGTMMTDGAESFSRRKGKEKIVVSSSDDESETHIHNFQSSSILACHDSVPYDSNLLTIQHSSTLMELTIKKQYRYSFIISVLDKTIGYHKLSTRLGHLLPLSRPQLIDLGLGFFLLKISNPSDHTMVESKLPLSIPNYCVTFMPWKPNFKPSEEKITCVDVWVQLPELPIEYYDILPTIAAAIGRPLKIDPITEKRKICRFARFSVKIDLNRPLNTHTMIGATWQSIVYEGLEMVCSLCRRYGHLQQNCLINVTSAPAQASTSSGSVTALPQPSSIVDQSIKFYSTVIHKTIVNKEISTTPVTELSNKILPTLYSIRSGVMTLEIGIALSPDGLRDQHIVSFQPRVGDFANYPLQNTRHTYSEIVSQYHFQKLLCWKYNGADNIKLVQTMKYLKLLENPSIVLILGIKCRGKDTIQAVEEIGFSGSYIIDGGIWLLWNKEDVKIEVYVSSLHKFCAEVNFLPQPSNGQMLEYFARRLTPTPLPTKVRF